MPLIIIHLISKNATLTSFKYDTFGKRILMSHFDASKSKTETTNHYYLGDDIVYDSISDGTTSKYNSYYFGNGFDGGNYNGIVYMSVKNAHGDVVSCRVMQPKMIIIMTLMVRSCRLFTGIIKKLKINQ